MASGFSSLVRRPIIPTAILLQDSTECILHFSRLEAIFGSLFALNTTLRNLGSEQDAFRVFREQLNTIFHQLSKAVDDATLSFQQLVDNLAKVVSQYYATLTATEQTFAILLQTGSIKRKIDVDDSDHRAKK